MSEEKTVTSNEAPLARVKRKERTPINGTATKLSLTGEEPGFHYAWINDDFVGTAEDAGYEFVTHAIKIGNKHVDISTMQGAKIQRNVGNQVIAYLMRTPQAWYDEDQKAHQRDKVDATEARIFEEINSNGLNGSITIGWDNPTPRINRGG